MKWWILLVSLALVAFTAWLILYAGVALSTLLSLGVGAIFLVWLIVLLTVPWNLYFTARGVLRELPESRARGIDVPVERDVEAATMARRLLRLAIGGHVISAAAVAVITYFAGVQLGYYFSGFYLLAIAFRPAAAYFAHVRARLSAMSGEAHHPPLDVIELRDRVTRIDTSVGFLLEEADRLRRDLALVSATTEAADRDQGRRIEAMARRFEETVDRAHDNQELITGLKAFIRLVRSSSP
ncbi:hypothetical protein ACIBHX_18145 [Nonomuraea sp. NPDC050536]|uniref:hypothetical protein n=1 Tax=Nonomuraea sp. NPDC050536 TaxID=3364366 RepID=UPI0037C92562